MIPERIDRPHDKYDRLLAAARGGQPMATAVVHPCDAVSLQSAVEAARIDLIAPILVGPAAKIRADAAVRRRAQP
jgi:phosphate acetyltransferase